MEAYIEKYIERVSDVPAHLQRNFKLIRDLDERSARIQAEVEEKCRQQLAAMQPGANGKKAGQSAKRARAGHEDPLSAEIAAGQAQVVSFAEEKVCAAVSSNSKQQRKSCQAPALSCMPACSLLWLRSTRIV